VLPPTVALLRSSVNSHLRTATFVFKTRGDATGLQCALVRPRRGKPSKPVYTACGLTKKYRRLSAGATYVLYVRAVGPGGTSTIVVSRQIKVN
jgi:hypothetical protein